MATAKHRRRPQRYLLGKLMSFVSIGAFVMVVGIGTLAFCVEVLDVQPQVAYAVQAFVSIELNFVLNYALTWGKRGKTEAELRRREHFWPALVKFHVTKLYTVPLNQILFACLMQVPWPFMHWLAAHVICAGVSSTLMYVSADKVVFVRGRWPHWRDLWPFGWRKSVIPMDKVPSAPSPAVKAIMPEFTTRTAPWFSVVIPTKNGGEEVAETAIALLNQDYPGNIEVIVVADPGDPVREHLAPLLNRVSLYEADIKSPGRDSNAKRDIGLSKAHPASSILAVMDADVIPEPTWAPNVARRIQDGADAVAGPVSGLGNSFWTRYIDKVPVGRKMPDNVDADFVLNRTTIARRKPMVTANFAFSRDAYETAGGPNRAFTNSYEDYEWMSRMVQLGLNIVCTKSLACQRYHREGLKALMGEYYRSGKGCADHVYTHLRGCTFARKRMRQLAVFHALVWAIISALVFAPKPTVAAGSALTLALMAHSFWKVRRLEALTYPLITLYLGWKFIRGFTNGIIRRYVAQQGLVHPVVGHVCQIGRRDITEETLAIRIPAPAEMS